jgi:hypothetical protein
VNSDAAADESPVGALFGRGAKKSRESGEWRGNTATIDERDDQLVVGACNIDGVCNWFTGQSAHPKQ